MLQGWHLLPPSLLLLAQVVTGWTISLITDSQPSVTGTAPTPTIFVVTGTSGDWLDYTTSLITDSQPSVTGMAPTPTIFVTGTSGDWLDYLFDY